MGTKTYDSTRGGDIMTVKKILFTREEVQNMIDILSTHWFSDDGEYNHEDIISLQQDLEKKLEKHTQVKEAL